MAAAPSKLAIDSTPTIAGSRPGRRPTFLTQESRQRTLPFIPRRAKPRAVPSAAHSDRGFFDGAPAPRKRLAIPGFAPALCAGLLTLTALRCSARQTGESAHGAQTSKAKR